MFVLDFEALENGKVVGKSVAGNFCIGTGRGLNLLGDAAQKVADGLHAAGDACIKKGEELKGEVKKEVPKQAAAPAKKKAAPKKVKKYGLSDIVAKYPKFAPSASLLSKHYKDVYFKELGGNMALILEGVNKKTGDKEELIAYKNIWAFENRNGVRFNANDKPPVTDCEGKAVKQKAAKEPASAEKTEESSAEVEALLNSEPVIEDAEIVEEAQEVPAAEEQETPAEEVVEEAEIDGMDMLVAAHPECVNGIQLMQRKFGQLDFKAIVAGGRYAVVENDKVTITIDLEEGTMAHKEKATVEIEVPQKTTIEGYEKLEKFDGVIDVAMEIAKDYDDNCLKVEKVARGVVFMTGYQSGAACEVRIKVASRKWAAINEEVGESFASAYGLKIAG